MAANGLLGEESRKKPNMRATRRLVRKQARQRGPHGKLPTVRELCADLGTNITVIDCVLTELEQQQVIYRRQGSGIYACGTRRRTVALLFGASFVDRPIHSPFWDILLRLLA